MRQVVTRERDMSGAIVYEHEQTIHFVPRRYAGPWSGMRLLSDEGLRALHAQLGDRVLGMQAVRVLVAMLLSTELHGDNRVLAGRKDLANLLAMSESNVSAALKALVDCGFVEAPRLRHAAYVISPSFAWYGTTAALRGALVARGLAPRERGEDDARARPGKARRGERESEDGGRGR